MMSRVPTIKQEDKWSATQDDGVGWEWLDDLDLILARAFIHKTGQMENTE